METMIHTAVSVLRRHVPFPDLVRRLIRLGLEFAFFLVLVLVLATIVPVARDALSRNRLDEMRWHVPRLVPRERHVSLLDFG